MSPSSAIKANEHGPQGKWQINGAINEGNSGGPVFNTSGRLVGLVFGDFEQARNLAYAVPLNLFTNLFDTAVVSVEQCEAARTATTAATAAPTGAASQRETRVVEQWSDWRIGGYNQRAWCNDVRTNFEREIGQSVEWEVIASDEQSKEEFIRRFFYRYYCKGQATWGGNTG